jgi:AcrR family transcriptional regulator
MKSQPVAVARREYTQTVRAQAAEETRKRILEAFIARLTSDWFDQITLDVVAADAGVTVQTVIRRFGGKEGLLGDAVKILTERINAQRGSPAGNVDAMVRSLYEDYERTGDPVIRLLALEPRYPAVSHLTNTGRREHRKWVSEAMTDALSETPADERQRLLDELVIVTDVYTWKLLRRDFGRSLPSAIATTKAMVDAVIGGTDADKSHIKPKA